MRAAIHQTFYELLKSNLNLGVPYHKCDLDIFSHLFVVNEPPYFKNDRKLNVRRFLNASLSRYFSSIKVCRTTISNLKKKILNFLKKKLK
jgi:hypothetical protein